MDRFLNTRFSRDAITILVGSVIFAVGLDCFEIPNGLAAGGASGLATIVAELCRRNGLLAPPIGMQVLAVNALLMVVVVREGGLRYAARSAIGILASALATRSEMAYLHHIVTEIDPRATIVVGKIHEASYNEF